MSVTTFPLHEASVVALHPHRHGTSRARSDEPHLPIPDRVIRLLVAEAISRDSSLASELIDLVARQNRSARARVAEPLLEPLTDSEVRVLRYLPTNLSKREIADELYVSVNTIKTHVKHLYAKLGVRTRRQAVDQARQLGLLPRSLGAALRDGDRQ
jgi:DNA-binding NarL/FixJ family response regulator